MVPFGVECDKELWSKGKRNQTQRMRMVRFKLYCRYTWLKVGSDRMDRRYPIPTCIEAEIKNWFPDPKGKYAFFKVAKKQAKNK